MNPVDWTSLALPVLLAAGVALGSGRLLVTALRQPAAGRPRPWRTTTLLLLHLVCGALLYLLLRSPAPGETVHTLHVVTARARGSVPAQPPPGVRWLRLPEATAHAGAIDVPDLATALRRYPAVRLLHVSGEGLVPRDRAVPSTLRLVFTPADPLPGITDWWAPTAVNAGDAMVIRGRAHAPVGSRIELLDPAGQRVDMDALQGANEFALHTTPRAAGTAQYRLRLREAGGRTLDDTRIAVQVGASVPATLLLRSGGPDPELKYLRRWAADGGARLRASISLGSGVQAGDPAVALTADSLAGTDVLILDDRSWNALGPSQRGAVLDAVRRGLGLLLRASAPLADSGALRLQVSAARMPTSYRLADAQPGWPALERPPLALVNPGGHSLLRDDRGVPLAGWRAHGRGRIGVWLPTDTFRLALAGHASAHAALWASVINAVARPRLAATARLPLRIHAGTRAMLCDLGADPRVMLPGNAGATALVVDPATGADRCATFWPTRAGWHGLRDGGRERVFLVRGAGEDRALRAEDTRRATLALADQRTTTRAVEATLGDAPPRWAWFLLWLAASAPLWWFERSRLGRVRA